MSLSYQNFAATKHAPKEPVWVTPTADSHLKMFIGWQWCEDKTGMGSGVVCSRVMWRGSSGGILWLKPSLYDRDLTESRFRVPHCFSVCEGANHPQDIHNTISTWDSQQCTLASKLPSRTEELREKYRIIGQCRCWGRGMFRSQFSRLDLLISVHSALRLCAVSTAPSTLNYNYVSIWKAWQQVMVGRASHKLQDQMLALE